MASIEIIEDRSISDNGDSTAIVEYNQSTSTDGTLNTFETGRANSDYAFLKKIGQGSFGKIYLVQRNGGPNNGNFYAIKKVQRKDKSNILTELNVLTKLNNCPYIVKIHDSIWEQLEVFLILDFIPGGDLYNYIKTNGKVDTNQARLWASEIAYAINRLHGMDILYGDLKIENIMIDARGHIVLTDFGLSSFLQPPYKAYKISGTFHYMAPEVFSNEMITQRAGYSFEVDWWALGIVLYEMLCGEQLYDISYQNVTIDHVKSKLMKRINLTNIEEKVRDDLAADLIYRLNEKDPRFRIGRNFNDIKAHKFFKSIIWSDVADVRGPVIYTPTLSSLTDTRYFDLQFSSKNVSRETSDAAFPMEDSIQEAAEVVEARPADRQMQAVNSNPVLNVIYPTNDEENVSNGPIGNIRDSMETVIAIQNNISRRPCVVLNKLNNCHANGNILNNDIEENNRSAFGPANDLNTNAITNNVPNLNVIEIEDVQEPNEEIIVNETLVIKTEMNCEENLLNVSTLFNQSNRKQVRNMSLFHKNKVPRSNNSTLKVFRNGSYIEIDETKCLQWIASNLHDLVKFSAIPNEFTEKKKRKRRSERIACRDNIDYYEHSTALTKRNKNV